jgi:hypothetical protein
VLKRTALETPAPAVGGGSSPSTVRWFGDIVGAYLSGAATSLDGMDRSALLAPGMLRPAYLKSKLNPPIFAKRRRRAAHYSGSVRLHGRDRSALRRLEFKTANLWSLVAMRGTSENAFAFTASISAFCASAGATPRGSSSLRWQYHAVYNALVRTHLSRSADVSATIGRDYVVDFVVGNRRPYAVHFNFVVVANHATLGRPTIH